MLTQNKRKSKSKRNKENKPINQTVSNAQAPPEGNIL
jgi:hypothetical protein